MFKKLKERIESVEESNLEKGSASLKRPPGLAIRSPPSESENTTLEFPTRAHDNVMIEEPPMIVGDQSSVGGKESGRGSDQEEEDTNVHQSTKKKNDNHKVQSVLGQLTAELMSLRRQYDQLLKEKETREEELTDEINELQTALQEKEKTCHKMETKISELSWTVDSLTSRLQIYSNYQDNEVIQKLQKQISELESSLRQRDLDIELYETRISAQSKQRHDDQMASIKKTHNLQDHVTSLQTSMKEKEEKLSYLTSELKKIRSQLGDVEKRRQELEDKIDQQKENINLKEQELEHQVASHSQAVDQLNEEHSKEVNNLKEELKNAKEELKDKEQKLERIVNELPNQPVIRTVLEGYSRTHMANSFSSTLRTPGLVYRKEVDPLIGPDPRPSMTDNRTESPPAILPIENHTDIGDDINKSMDFDMLSQYELLELRRYSETLEEELVEKNKTIRLQQQKLTDMKKALNKELKPSPPKLPSLPPSLLPLPISFSQPPLSQVTLKSMEEENTPKSSQRFVISSDINFQYLKNVVVRFLCSREDEACQLVRAVATLLELSNEEEKYVRDYLQYKMSWFGTMPTPPNAPNKTVH